MSKHLKMHNGYSGEIRLAEEPYDAFTKPMNFNIRFATQEEWELIRKTLKLRPEDNEPHKQYEIVKGGQNE